MSAAYDSVPFARAAALLAPIDDGPVAPEPPPCVLPCPAPPPPPIVKRVSDDA